MKQLYKQVRKEYSALFRDLDIYSHYEQVNTYENFIHTLKLNGYRDSQDALFIVFLDEFQRYADISSASKAICDHHPNVKVYASGSSSLAINEKIQESLAGRKRILPVYPLRFTEYLHFIEKDDLIRQVRNFFINNFNKAEIRGDISFLFEGFVISDLIVNLESNRLKKGFQHVSPFELPMLLSQVP